MVDLNVVADLGARVAAAYPPFDVAGFHQRVMARLPDLELKDRIAAVADELRRELPGEYRRALDVLVAVARAEPPIEGFAAWPLCTFVELFGVDDPDSSLAAMEHLTKRASCEFAIRPFLVEHWDDAYARLMAFTAHADEAVRRLASEGSRPRLPWARRVPRLVADPAPGLALLERLRHDPSESVRRSVANHLNDIAKGHPGEVVATVKRWLRERPPVDRSLVTHGLRTLVKRGDPDALAVLGFTAEAEVEVVAFSVTPRIVEMGDRIELEVTLRSTASERQHLVVDFVVHHVTAAGGSSPKVFKWTTVDLDPGAHVTLRKRRQIQHMSTRTYHPGSHAVELQVAGAVVGRASFVIEQA